MITRNKPCLYPVIFHEANNEGPPSGPPFGLVTKNESCYFAHIAKFALLPVDFRLISLLNRPARKAFGTLWPVERLEPIWTYDRDHQVILADPSLSPTLSL